MHILDHLTQEHRKVEDLIAQLKGAEPSTQTGQLVGELAASLATHMAVEEQFLYPLVAEHLGEEEASDATDEHQLAREGLEALQARTEDGAFEAALEILEQGISHHVQEEESDIFPKLREAASDQLAAMDPEQLEAQVADGPSASGSGSGDEPTRDELYEQAKEQGIEGRSTMTKSELAEAVEAEPT
ncbi:MAG: hemerythrin domain-containing protein [Acidimicrobiales bacterium]